MNDEVETEEKPSNGRKITAALVTLAVTVVVGMASSGITEKINDKIRKQIIKA